MTDDALEFVTADTNFPDKLNRKSLVVGNSTQLTNLKTTYPGQLVYSTSTGGVFTSGQTYKRNSANTTWVLQAYHVSEELNSTPVTDDNQSSIINNRYYAYHTLPTDYKFYIITGIEWKNGSSVAGNIMTGVDAVDADTPTLNSTPLLALGQEATQTGTSAVQRVSIISSKLIKAGTIVGIWINGSGAGLFRYQTISSANRIKNIAGYDATPSFSDNSGWSASTVGIYLKLYYIGYNI